MFIVKSIAILAIVTVYLMHRLGWVRPLRPSRLAKVAMLLILSGIVIADVGRVVSYSLMGGGVFLALIDIIKRSSRQRS